MNNPLVSIIIPTFNRAHLIGETLDSVLAQTYENWECIIVDDGSNDNTDEVVGGYLTRDFRFQYHQRPTDRLKGANACRNYGFEVSKGEYVMFLDSDDIIEIFCISDRIALITKDLTVDLLIRDTSLFKGDKKENISINIDPDFFDAKSYLRMFLRYEIPWQTMGGFYKRSVLYKSQFDEKLKRFQDVSFNIKVLLGYSELKLIRDRKIDSYYRIGEHDICGNDFVKLVLNSLVCFYEINRYLLNNGDYKADLKKFNSAIIVQFLIPYFNENRRESNKVLFWSARSKMYNFEEKIIFLVWMLFLNVGIIDKKGIGMYRFRKQIKKIIY